MCLTGDMKFPLRISVPGVVTGVKLVTGGKDVTI